jgi:hypothetical protein
MSVIAMKKMGHKERMDAAARKTPADLPLEWLQSVPLGQNQLRTQGRKRKAIVGQSKGHRANYQTS